MELPELTRDNKLPAFTDLGGYPIIYHDREGSTLCAECATKSHLNPDEITPFKPWACDVYYEGPAIQCDGCNADIASSYGDPASPVQYEVVVGNIGTVVATADFAVATATFTTYKQHSVDGYGRAAGEPVVIMADGEPMGEWDYPGTLTNEEE